MLSMPITSFSHLPLLLAPTLELSDTNYHAIPQPISNEIEGKGKGDWT